MNTFKKFNGKTNEFIAEKELRDTFFQAIERCYPYVVYEYPRPNMIIIKVWTSFICMCGFKPKFIFQVIKDN